MTRQDFQAIADVLAEARTITPADLSTEAAAGYEQGQDEMFDGLVKALGDVLAASNGRFDRGRFEYAAGVRP
jgi:hypothetical protein